MGTPQCGRRAQRRAELGLGLVELAAQVLRVSAPQLDREDGEDEAAPVRLRTDGIPLLDRLVEVGKCQREDRGDREIAGVRGHERAVPQGCPRQGNDLVRPAGALGPLPGRDCGEHPRAGTAFRVDRAMAPQALEPLAVVVASPEEERDQLAGLELQRQVVELRGKLEGRPARDLGGLVGSLHEDQRAGEPVGGVSPTLRVGGAVVGAAKRVGRVRQRRERLRAPELEEQLGPLLRCQRLGERAAERGDRCVRSPRRECCARGCPEDGDDPVLSVPRHRQDVRGDVLGRCADLEQEPRRALVVQLPLARREVAVDGCLNERMDEAERRIRPQDLRSNELSARGGDGLAVEAGERTDHTELCPVAENGERARHVHRVGREPRQTEEHRP